MPIKLEFQFELSMHRGFPPTPWVAISIDASHTPRPGDDLSVRLSSGDNGLRWLGSITLPAGLETTDGLPFNVSFRATLEARWTLTVYSDTPARHPVYHREDVVRQGAEELRGYLEA